MTNVTFAVAVKHWQISLLNVILVKYFGLILLLGGIVKITCKSNFNSVIFYLLFILVNAVTLDLYSSILCFSCQSSAQTGSHVFFEG